MIKFAKKASQNEGKKERSGHITKIVLLILQIESENFEKYLLNTPYVISEVLRKHENTAPSTK